MQRRACRRRKQAKTNPRAIAQTIAERLKANPIFAKVEIAGPGFINLDVTDEALTARAGALAKDARLGAPETGKGKAAVLDFGGPNIAKPMHVGHLRSARSSATACSGCSAPMAGR